jgi:hypothetical protein
MRLLLACLLWCAALAATIALVVEPQMQANALLAREVAAQRFELEQRAQALYRDYNTRLAMARYIADLEFRTEQMARSIAYYRSQQRS